MTGGVVVVVVGVRRRGGRRLGRRRGLVGRVGDPLGVAAVVSTLAQHHRGDHGDDDGRGGEDPWPCGLLRRRFRGDVRHRGHRWGRWPREADRGGGQGRDRPGDHDGLADVRRGPFLQGHRERRDRHPERLLGAAEGLTELGRGGESSRRFLGHAPVDHVGQRCRHPAAAQVGRRLGQHPVEHRQGALVGDLDEGRGAGKQLVERGGQPVDVAGGRRGLALHDFRGGVGRSAGDDAAGGEVGAALEPGDAEVGQDGLAERRDEDVLGFHVPVQHAGPVGGLEGAGHLDADGGHLGPGDGPSVPHLVRQRAAGLEAHDQVGQALVGDPLTVDADDVGVLGQPADRPQLLLEAAADPLVDPGHHDDLDGHVAGEGWLVALVDHGHAATADLLQALDPGDRQGGAVGHQRGARAR